MEQNSLKRKTGSGIMWKAIQLLGTRVVTTFRTLLLSYILLPQDFGLFAVTFLCIDLLSTLTDFGLISALVQKSIPDRDDYDSVWTIILFRGIGISLLVFIFAPLLSEIFSQPEASPFIRLAAFKPLFESSASIKIAELTRLLKFRQLTYLRVCESLISLIIAFIFSLLYGVWGLIIGILSGSLTFTVLSYFLAPYKPRLILNYTAIKPMLNFSKWIYFSILVSIAGSFSVQVIITRELGLIDLGYYFLAIHLAFLPSEIIKEVFGTVMFPVTSLVQHDVNRLTNIYNSFSKIIFMAIIPLCILMLFMSPFIVERVLSAKWEGTIMLIQIFAVVNLIGLPGETAVPLFTGVNRTRYILILECIQTTLLLLSCWSFIKLWGVNGAAAAWIPAILVSQFACYFYLSRLLKRPFRNMPGPVLFVLIVSIASSLIGHFISASYSGVTGLLSGIVISVLLIASSVMFADHYYNFGIRRSFITAFPQLAYLVKQ